MATTYLSLMNNVLRRLRENLMQGYNDELFTEAVMQNLYRNN